MTSPRLPIGGSAPAGSTAPPPPPPPPPPGGSNVSTQTTVTSSVTATVSPPAVAGSSPVSLATSVTSSVTATVSSPSTGAIPAFDHIVMVLLENHGYTQIIGSPNAPYINSLVPGGALFTDSHGIGHPSFPNYLALFCGNHIVNVQPATGGDTCPPPGQPYSLANMASVLIAAGRTFGGYAESAPASRTACGPSPYAGRHVPWVWFSTAPAGVHHDFSAFPTTSGGYAALPTVSIVVPDLSHDMHSFGTLTDAQTVQAGDTWIRQHLDGYAQWAKTNNSLYIIQLDEDNFTNADRIPTLFVGQHVKAGQYAEASAASGVTGQSGISHYNILRTLCDAYGAARPGLAATATPITDCWN